MIGWIDGGAGASGDMLLGALIDAGVPLEVVAEAIDGLDLGIVLQPEAVQRASLGATRIHVEVPDTTVMRHLPDVVALFGMLDPAVQAIAVEVFERLAAAEAAVHRMPVEQVHFHEVGALDSIADVVGAAAGLVHLNLTRLCCSRLSLGSGSTRGSHGPIPVPAPAVLELLAGDIPVQAGPAPFESTTPTGAAVLVTVVDKWGPLPAMRVNAVGKGAGARDSDQVANLLRLVIGTEAR
ncbi:MAG: LarC family nickel insertion protein [Acidimicrobiales bacterium]|nr:LarC family nickel insertion protein [Acidimicrobiales bacterium]